MSKIDLSYRPNSYFAYKELGIPVDEIKGSSRRLHYKAALNAGVNHIDPFVSKPKLSEEERQMLGRVHPSFMGGEYLPDTDIEEVEIARIAIASTTYDVTCVYASFKSGKYQYRIVDEYGGDTISGSGTKVSKEPLTLKALMDFFLKGWDIFCCLDANFSDYNYEPRRVKRFIVDASSSFYSEFGDLLDERVDKWLSIVRKGMEEEEVE